jgi:Conserved protein/domain typically associated with flavoprotein oxygenases, DIM6/NTAB family
MSMITLNTSDFSAMEKRYRVHFINSLSGYKSANLVGTIDEQGVTNLSIVNSVVHLGADPALIAFVNRPHSVARNTLDNIYSAKCYTISHVATEFFEDAHHTSARYAPEISEFDQTTLTAEYHSLAAPYVAQSQIKMGVEFRQKIDIELNGTVLVIGEIVEVILDDSLIVDDGKLDLQQANTVATSGLDEYHTTASLGRLAYAKPKA